MVVHILLIMSIVLFIVGTTMVLTERHIDKNKKKDSDNNE